MPDAKMYLEKRVHPRVSAHVPVKFRLIEDSKEIETVFNRQHKDKTSRTMDLSLGGLYLVADVAVNVGSILRLDMVIPGQTAPIAAFAEVVWSNSEGLGLHFLAMKEEDIEALKTYLSKNPPGN
jgi:hypothetical protein